MANNVDMGQINWTVKATADQASDSVKKLSNNVSGLSKVLKLVNFTAFIASCKRIGTTIYGLVNQTSQYIQKMNQFKSIMGDSAKEAQGFIDKAERILGLDPEQMMGSLSSFQTLTKGFGIASDEAYKMSKNLTQLAADMSSFTGESMDLALQRLKSGISGEIEPMRKWGIALDQATLQERAHALGINKKVSEMTRAQKTELAYYQIMHATQYAQGNMARTLLTPASALRIVQTEFKQLGRAMGSVFIPIAMKIIPVIRAITQILTELARKLADLFGFKISDYEVKDVAASFGDLEDNVNGTTKALKKMLMPFDELNNVNFDTGKGSKSGITGVGGSLGLDTYDYDMFAGASDEINKKVEQIKNTFEKLKPVIVAVGGALAAIWAIDKIMTFVDWIDKVKKHSSELKTALEIGLVIAGAYLLYKGIKHAIDTKTMDAQSILQILAGGTLIAAAGALKFKNPAILKIGILATFDIVLLTSMIAWWNEYFEQEKKQIYGDKKKLNLGEAIYVGLSSIGEGFNAHVIEKIFGEDALKPITDWVANVMIAFDNLKTMIKNKIDEIKTNVVQGFENFKTNASNKVEDMKNNVSSNFETFKSNIQQKATDIKNNVTTNFENLKTNVQQKVEDMKNNASSKFEDLKNNTRQKIEDMKNNVSTGFENMKTSIGDKILNIKTKVQNTFTDIKNGIVGKINDAKEGVRSAIDRIKGFFNFSWSLPKLKTPHLSWTSKPASGWISDVLSTLGLPTSLPKLNIEWYAGGGLPKKGQIFGANENGPELIGNIGRRTAVANQQQITEGISEATYNAFTRALNENKSDDNGSYFVINLEGDAIYNGFAKKENRYSNMYGVKL